MTLRLAIGIDPGTSGALAPIADGAPLPLIDMPVTQRADDGSNCVDAHALAARLRGMQLEHAGAHIFVAMERVRGFRGQSGARSFNFGQADGIVRGVLGALNLQIVEVEPKEWKRHHGLIDGAEKDAGRVLAMQRYPRSALQLMRKRDGGRGDALLIATWALETEAYHQRTDAPGHAATG